MRRINRDRDHAEEFIEHIPQYKGKPNLEGNMCVDNEWGVMVHGHDPDKDYPEPVSNPMMNSVEADNIHEDEEALIVKHDVMVSPIKEEHHQWAPGQEQLGSKDPADGIDPRTVKKLRRCRKSAPALLTGRVRIRKCPKSHGMWTAS